MVAEKKNNATCAICGAGYYMCLSCKDQIRLSPWKIHTDTSEHYKVFQILRGHTTGLYTKAEAKEKFKTVDLSDLETFLPEIKSAIKSILAEEKPEPEKEVVEQKFTQSKKRMRSKTAKTEQVDECEQCNKMRDMEGNTIHKNGISLFFTKGCEMDADYQ